MGYVRIPPLALIGSLSIVAGIIILMTTQGDAAGAWTALTFQVAGVIMLLVFLATTFRARKRDK
ncbi:hypothetical protein GCM10022198_20900 [Klugiella xanthotipulae]|uniref:Uncharacterized protein n=1 Tax=Klugiella xanthotipulae TaxID=244735 RepID=A0A543HXV5_9MICO|nr:hypothetical protein [Klugiella xanthotipulae]TQM63177.1 hypothetical protein FB466_1431 [Klugiella xanthotipulae]